MANTVHRAKQTVARFDLTWPGREFFSTVWILAMARFNVYFRSAHNLFSLNRSGCGYGANRRWFFCRAILISLLATVFKGVNNGQ